MQLVLGWKRRRVLTRFLGIALTISAALWAKPASAQERMYFPAVENVTTVLVAKIKAERVRVDLSAWLLTEHAISIALVDRLKAGVTVRVLGDRVSIFEADPLTKREFYWLASQGVPIRLRYHPTWFPEIDHWKATILAGQNVVSFGSANYTPFELAPASATDYKDETVLFTDDAAIVNAFKTRFDRMWNDTLPEIGSMVAAPPYFLNWNDACARESACADYRTLYPAPAHMAINTARLEPDYPMPADMIWSQGALFNNRLIAEINRETRAVDLAVYRLTVDSVADALLAKFRSGVPVRVLIDPAQYTSRLWPEYWITHATIDRLWAAGVPIRQRVHAGLTHMKMLITSHVATNASSNIAANWQRDHNYFVPALTKPLVYQAMKDRFNAMWNTPSAFGPFTPGPPDVAVLANPASGATGLSTTPTLTWNRAPFATSFDVYLGTAPSSMVAVANVRAEISSTPPETYSWRPLTPLQPGTTYHWKVVSRTFATPRNPALVSTSASRSFTTLGTALALTPPPSPWATADVGAVGADGSTSFANGTFIVRGSGANVWGTSDGFHYVYRPLNGDGTIVTRLVGMDNTRSNAKAGLMLRESLSASAAHVILDGVPSGGVEFMTRPSNGAATTWIAGATQARPAWLKLARAGAVVTGSVSANGTTWTPVGSITVSIGSSALVGLVVSSAVAGVLNAATFDSVTVTSTAAPPPPPPPPPPPVPEVVIYASDIPSTALRGSWTRTSDATSPLGLKHVSADRGIANLSQPLASPTDYFDATFTAVAGTPYRIWLRLKAGANSKYNDAVWVQFSDARVNGSPIYPINSSSGLLVNLATDSLATSLDGWGWQNGAYWLSQPTIVTFPTNGTRTLRVQIREDGVEVDQIVLSPAKYLSSAPGRISNDATIVAKP
jgi:hypothetical protein